MSLSRLGTRADREKVQEEAIGAERTLGDLATCGREEASEGDFDPRGTLAC